MRYIWKALEKGYSEHPGSVCCTDDMLEILDGACLARCLVLLTGSYHVFI